GRADSRRTVPAAGRWESEARCGPPDRGPAPGLYHSQPTTGAPDGRSAPGGPSRLHLQPLAVVAAELGHLGRDDEAAVALVGVLLEVALVVRLSREELRQGDDLGHDGLAPQPGGGELRDHRLRRRLLLGGVIEDRRAVLRAHV